MSRRGGVEDREGLCIDSNRARAETSKNLLCGSAPTWLLAPGYSTSHVGLRAVFSIGQLFLGACMQELRGIGFWGIFSGSYRIDVCLRRGDLLKGTGALFGNRDSTT